MTLETQFTRVNGYISIGYKFPDMTGYGQWVEFDKNFEQLEKPDVAGKDPGLAEVMIQAYRQKIKDIPYPVSPISRLPTTYLHLGGSHDNIYIKWSNYAGNDHPNQKILVTGDPCPIIMDPYMNVNPYQNLLIWNYLPKSLSPYINDLNNTHSMTEEWPRNYLWAQLKMLEEFGSKAAFLQPFTLFLPGFFTYPNSYNLIGFAHKVFQTLKESFEQQLDQYRHTYNVYGIQHDPNPLDDVRNANFDTLLAHMDPNDPEVEKETYNIQIVITLMVQLKKFLEKGNAQVPLSIIDHFFGQYYQDINISDNVLTRKSNLSHLTLYDFDNRSIVTRCAANVMRYWFLSNKGLFPIYILHSNYHYNVRTGSTVLPDQ